MDENKFKEKLVELLSELSKPKKYEVGYVQPNRTVNDGLNMIGVNANDILGFARTTEDRRVRRSRGAQAWFKKMYEDGWRYAGNFEYEGLLNNGFVVMERELPNKVLDAIREELEILIRDEEGEKYKHVPSPEILRGLPGMTAVPGSLREGKIEVKPVEERMETTRKALKKMGYKEEEITTYILPKLVKEPKEGFQDEGDEFIQGSAEDLKTLEQSYFDETGKKAIWRGKETKAFKSWKEILN